MSVVSFERAAYLRQPMPDGLCLSEQKAFLALRFLYAEFDRGVISKEQAALEKQMLIRQHWNHEIKIDKLNERIAQLWKRIEEPAREMSLNSSVGKWLISFMRQFMDCQTIEEGKAWREIK